MTAVGLVIIFLVFLIIDVFFVLSIRYINKKGKIFRFFNKLIPLLSILFLLFAVGYTLYLGSPEDNPKVFSRYFAITGVGFLLYIPKLAFLIFSIPGLALWQLIKIIFNFAGRKNMEATILFNILGTNTWAVTGVIASSIFMGALVWGMIAGKTNYKLVEKEIQFPELPAEFDQLKIVHISDLHLGSFKNPGQLEKGLNMIREAKPDLILFTGDMVNASPDEAEDFINIFKALEAPLGKYAILGNHDMGDYMRFDSENARKSSVQELINIHTAMGFKTLNNEHIILDRNGDSLAIAGVENWGLPPFKQYGDLAKATKGLEDHFCILLSHDPSHWDQEVKNKECVKLTLSGHTHGMQFGIDMKGLQWSPVKWKYPKWMGLYKEGEQYLYVNPGFGFIGLPGRIGIRPEVTVLTLKAA